MVCSLTFFFFLVHEYELGRGGGVCIKVVIISTFQTVLF